jgi:hypothetical protein
VERAYRDANKEIPMLAGKNTEEKKSRDPEIILVREQGILAGSSCSRDAQENNQLLLSAENWACCCSKVFYACSPG